MECISYHFCDSSMPTGRRNTSSDELKRFDVGFVGAGPRCGADSAISYCPQASPLDQTKSLFATQSWTTRAWIRFAALRARFSS